MQDSTIRAETLALPYDGCSMHWRRSPWATITKLRGKEAVSGGLPIAAEKFGHAWEFGDCSVDCGGLVMLA